MSREPPPPPKIPELSKEEAEVRKWEDHLKTLAQFRRPCRTLLRCLAPDAADAVHDFARQTLGNEAKYEETAELVRAFVAHKVAAASSGAVPMDVCHAEEQDKE